MPLRRIGKLQESDIVSSMASEAEVTAAINAHTAVEDPHTQYLNSSRGDARYRLASATVPESANDSLIARDSEVAAAINAHISAEHTQAAGYVKQQRITNYSQWSDFEKNLYLAGEWLQGQGSYYTESGTADHPGIISLNCTNASSWSSVNTEKSFVLSSPYTAYFIFKSPSWPNGTDNYEVNCGYCENPGFQILGSEAVALRIKVEGSSLAWYFYQRWSQEIKIPNISCTPNTWYTVVLKSTEISFSITINNILCDIPNISPPTAPLRLFINIYKLSGSATSSLFLDAVGINGILSR